MVCMPCATFSSKSWKNTPEGHKNLRSPGRSRTAIKAPTEAAGINGTALSQGKCSTQQTTMPRTTAYCQFLQLSWPWSTSSGPCPVNEPFRQKLNANELAHRKIKQRSIRIHGVKERSCHQKNNCQRSWMHLQKER